MKLPIPKDWNGEDWFCLEVQWPDSPEYVGLLFGFLTQMTRGRFWDESTGSIKDAQSIGWQIHDLNFPIVTCDGSEPPEPTKEYIYRFMSSVESEEIMTTLCGYNPKAFKIESGVLYVRDFCGDWVAIGALDNQVDPPPADDNIDPPPPGGQDSTPCAIAGKLATFVYNIVAESFNQMGGVEAIDIWDYYNDMNDAFHGVDLAFDDLMNMWASTVALDAAGLEGETQSLDAIQYLKCNWVDLIDATNDGIDSDTYQAMIDIADSALRGAFPKGSWSGFGDEMRRLWTRSLKSIGSQDAKKITYYVQTTGLEDCSCPDDGSATDPTENGWYLGEALPGLTCNVPYDEGAGFPKDSWGWAWAKQVAQEDIFGCVVTLELQSGSMGIMKRANDPIDFMGTYDHYLSGGNSDSYGMDIKLAQMKADEFDELGLAAQGYTRVEPLAGDSYTGPSTPPVDKGLTCLMAYSLQQDGSNTGVVKMSNFRWMHNTGSPNHD